MEFFSELVASELSNHPCKPILHLFGAPYVTVGKRRIDIPEGSQKLLAFVAIRRASVERRTAAGILWPTGNDVRAAGNLRTSLWRLNGVELALISADKTALRLADDAAVDLHIVSSWATRMIADRPKRTDLALLPLDMETFDLLP